MPSPTQKKQALSPTRLRTRRKLVEAALRVMGQKGVEGTSIAEIRAEAGVSFGSFYNNFGSLEELAQEVFAERAMGVATELDAIPPAESDPAIAAARVQRRFVELAISDPVWGWFLLHADAALPQVEATFRKRVRHDLDRGRASGRFIFRSLDTTVTMTLAALMAVMRRILEGREPRSAAADMVELLLRQYGIDREEAARIAHPRRRATLRG
ncbi:MAG: hypothetical protein RLZZ200_1766 [Pseudomonadota bacterium]|jgi:AcrR family transcriptional regulator